MNRAVPLDGSGTERGPAKWHAAAPLTEQNADVRWAVDDRQR
jgi:hypothetical protein